MSAAILAMPTGRVRLEPARPPRSFTAGLWDRFRGGARKILGDILHAAGFYITNAVALVALNAIADAADAGTAAVINIYDGTPPADADAAEGNTLLAQLTMSATAFGNAADDTPGAIVTAASITADSSANATGTATHFRVLTQDGGTVVYQGTVGTSDADCILNTVSITSGSTVSISSFTISLPEGP